MKVKEVLALAAATLGRDDLAAEVYDLTGEPAGELASLLRCYNLVENEIALDYFPLRHRQTFLPENGVVPFTQFNFAPVSITAIECESRPAKYDVYCDHLKIHVKPGERVTVLYSYSPAQRKWEDDSSFSEKISARLLAYGVASEFCLSHGQFSEAAMWEKKYREALKAANIIRRKLAVRSRRWA